MKTAAKIANQLIREKDIKWVLTKDIKIINSFDWDLLVINIAKALTDYAEARYTEGLHHGQDDAKEELEDTRNAALEEAARVAEDKEDCYCEKHGEPNRRCPCTVADLIRALKHSEAAPGTEETK